MQWNEKLLNIVKKLRSGKQMFRQIRLVTDNLIEKFYPKPGKRILMENDNIIVPTPKTRCHVEIKNNKLEIEVVDEETRKWVLAESLKFGYSVPDYYNKYKITVYVNKCYDINEVAQWFGRLKE